MADGSYLEENDMAEGSLISKIRFIIIGVVPHLFFFVCGGGGEGGGGDLVDNFYTYLLTDMTYDLVNA